MAEFNKLKILSILVVLFIPLIGLAKDAIGWHWYNEINIEDKKPKASVAASNQKVQPATLQMQVLRKMVREAKDKAILYPTEDNMHSYLILQNFVMEQAMKFTQIWKKTLLKHPDLDYSVAHPTQNNAQHIMREQVHKKETAAIQVLGQKYGILFFYRGNEQMDQELAPTIISFCQENHISLIPITVDGQKLTSFTTSQINNNHAEKLGIKHFPALVLVDPKSQEAVPLHYGFISDSDLRRRFLQIATNFKEEI